jgi:hypothetical protein
MKRPCSSSEAATSSSQAGALLEQGQGGQPVGARMATSIVHAQLGPRSIGLAAIQSRSCAPSSST